MVIFVRNRKLCASAKAAPAKARAMSPLLLRSAKPGDSPKNWSEHSQNGGSENLHPALRRLMTPEFQHTSLSEQY
jgi:hypothetical protein